MVNQSLYLLQSANPKMNAETEKIPGAQEWFGNSQRTRLI